MIAAFKMYPRTNKCSPLSDPRSKLEYLPPVCVVVCMGVGVFVSLSVSFGAHVRVFIPNRVRFQTTISLTALEQATKLKPYWVAVCRLLFD